MPALRLAASSRSSSSLAAHPPTRSRRWIFTVSSGCLAGPGNRRLHLLSWLSLPPQRGWRRCDLASRAEWSAAEGASHRPSLVQNSIGHPVCYRKESSNLRCYCGRHSKQFTWLCTSVDSRELSFEASGRWFRYHHSTARRSLPRREVSMPKCRPKAPPKHDSDPVQSWNRSTHLVSGGFRFLLEHPLPREILASVEGCRDVPP